MLESNVFGKAQNPDELIDLIDSLMSDGTGHVNIFSNDDSDSLKVETLNSTDCGIKGACCQPTEDAIDEDED